MDCEVDAEPHRDRSEHHGPDVQRDVEANHDQVDHEDREDDWQHREQAERADAPLEVIASVSDAADVDAYRRLGDAGVTHIKPNQAGRHSSLRDPNYGRFMDSPGSPAGHRKPV